MGVYFSRIINGVNMNDGTNAVDNDGNSLRTIPVNELPDMTTNESYSGKYVSLNGQ